MVAAAEIVTIDPLFGDDGVAMAALCERFGEHRTYGEHERIEIAEGPGLVPRHDSVRNYLRNGGMRGAQEQRRDLASRTSYFREEYAYGDRLMVEGIESFLHHGGLLEAARRVHGRPVVEPQIAFANLMVPGQELAVHTDVPEFRGANRKLVPQWLLVVMHHSGLFDAWRMPIATGIAYFSDDVGGALVYWPSGPSMPAEQHAIRTDTALVLDTDSVFHGVDRVDGAGDGPLPAIGPGAGLRPEGGGRWILRDPSGVDVAEYHWSDLRLSVSWKAYCFGDETERDSWRCHTDDLTLDAILDRLAADLADRTGAPVARDAELGVRLIDEYVRFPVPA